MPLACGVDSSLWTRVLGPVVAPERIGKVLWDMRHVGCLVLGDTFVEHHTVVEREDEG